MLLFYNLYEGNSRAEFESELLSRFGTLVRMPVLRAGRPPLPPAVEAVLEEGLEQYAAHAARHGKWKSSTDVKGEPRAKWDAWEAKLRATLDEHADYLQQIQVSTAAGERYSSEKALRVAARQALLSGHSGPRYVDLGCERQETGHRLICQQKAADKAALWLTSYMGGACRFRLRRPCPWWSRS